MGYWNSCDPFTNFGAFPELTRKGCRGSDIISFALVASMLICYVTVAGFLGFFNLYGVIDNEEIFTDKFYAQSYYVENYLVYPMLIYRIWNLTVCLVLAEFRSPDAIGHHIVTGCLAYFGLAPYAQYYALFYFGVAELSSIPLSLMDMLKHLPDLAAKYPAAQNAAKGSFAVAFFIIRIFWWPFVSYELFLGCVDLFRTQKAHSSFVAGFFLFANMFLTFLQFYWGFLIGRKVFSGGGRNQGKKRDAMKKD